MIYVKLFLTFFKIGLFNFGGGYAMISFLQNEVVFKSGWLTTAQFTDIVAVSQVTPGPVGINMATYTGYTVADAWGAAIATFAVCLPSFLLMIWLGSFLLKHQHSPRMQGVLAVLRPAVVGLIAAAALVLCNSENFIDYKSYFFFALAFLLVYLRKIGPVGVLLFSAAAGLICY
ncbi:chromate transporter [Candidatus Avelusimicrobium luingense]|uniref:chromate transporter n=1 Tax=Candidatus Avelusimicrobium luingense TaxID=3416211 RepID=UPI003D0C75BF